MASWEMSDRLRMGPVGLYVDDLDRVERFYRTVIGLQLRHRSASSVILGTEAEPLIHLLRDADSPGRSSRAAGLYHVAIRVPTRADLGAALRRIEAQDTLAGASDHGVSEALYLSDPAGHGVELYWDRPMSKWPRRDGNLLIPTDPLDRAGLRADASPGEGVPAETNIGHVHLEVTDLDRSRRFYRHALGLRSRYSTPGAVFLAAGSYHHHVAVNTWRGRSASAKGSGLAWISLLLPKQDLAALASHLSDSPPEAGIEPVTIEGPDDITIRILPAD